LSRMKRRERNNSGSYQSTAQYD